MAFLNGLHLPSYYIAHNCDYGGPPKISLESPLSIPKAAVLRYHLALPRTLETLLLRKLFGATALNRHGNAFH
ncbi:hypothetical protein L873DRAFT_1823111 [Choiromyces venosus 120613-1]|uniref:Uncharacterized protein n=1 Tax=Choiromyces venosus 120613-1 TaxID=1336337 RepID=A0A3N4ITR1_9PEZI|nr:hypothetical protein L873DRAFT_1823111 [Choiromyces venosus 120613-1]